jgi:hypothetical protein
VIDWWNSGEAAVYDPDLIFMPHSGRRQRFYFSVIITSKANKMPTDKITQLWVNILCTISIGFLATFSPATIL